ncbi:MAG: universal stress protein [Clostridia bacterium]|nr:universal stress protein [Clostridia bacterium]
MAYKNILIPTDGTLVSETIIDFICSIQKVMNAVINVVYVIEVPRNLPLGAQIPEKAEVAQTAINRVREIAEKHDVQVNTSIIYARTAEDSILSTAQELKCDVIAIAQDNQKLRIFSNTTSNIYQRSKCSVWLFNNKG